jgi:hypothetical protein
MKIITTLILTLAISPVYAEIYKCEVNGVKSYQQFPCKQGGKEFTPLKDISLEEQKSAVKKLDKELAVQAEQKKIQKEADDKERLIRAQEEKADAAYQNAQANKEQVLQNERRSQEIGYGYRRPYYPIVPVNPIERPINPIERPVNPIANPLPN